MEIQQSPLPDDGARLKYLFFCVIVALIFAGQGCSTVNLRQYNAGPKPEICTASQEPAGLFVLWGTAWRENQKEPQLRREIATRSIQAFFSSLPCRRRVFLLDSWNGQPAPLLSDTQALEAARAQPSPIGEVLIIRVEELGPFIKIYLSPILWEGGTEIILRIRMLKVSTGVMESDVTTHWIRGGPFVLRGVSSLDEDLAAALQSAFK